MNDQNDEWLTTEEAAAYLKISVGSLRNMTSNGHVPYYKLARRNRYRRDELRDLLLNEKRGPGALGSVDRFGFSGSRRR
jgi:excisionase family DNA binding protein